MIKLLVGLLVVVPALARADFDSTEQDESDAHSVSEAYIRRNLDPKSKVRAPLAKRITIRSLIRGEANAKHGSETTIVGGFLGYSSLGKDITDKQVKALLEALNSPPVPELSLENLGISSSWAARNKNRLLKGLTGKKREVAESKIKDPKFVRRLFERNFSTWVFHDWPEAIVEVELADSKYSLSSESRNWFMIPWSISKNGSEPVKSWNSKIGKAIAAMLEKDFVNQQRLAGTNFTKYFDGEVRDLLKDEFDAIDADARYGRQLARIKKRFRFVKSSNSIVYGMGYRVDGWHAQLEGTELPAGYSIEAHVTQDRKSGRLVALNQFERAIDHFVPMVLSVKWLKSWVETHPGTRVELTLVDGKSTTSDLWESITDDFEEAGKIEISKTLEPEFSECAFLTVFEPDDAGYSNWLLLKDGRMFLFDACAAQQNSFRFLRIA